MPTASSAPPASHAPQSPLPAPPSRHIAPRPSVARAVSSPHAATVSWPPLHSPPAPAPLGPPSGVGNTSAKSLPGPPPTTSPTPHPTAAPPHPTTLARAFLPFACCQPPFHDVADSVAA